MGWGVHTSCHEVQRAKHHPKALEDCDVGYNTSLSHLICKARFVGKGIAVVRAPIISTHIYYAKTATISTWEDTDVCLNWRLIQGEEDIKD